MKSLLTNVNPFVCKVVPHLEDDVVMHLGRLSVWLIFPARFAHNNHLSQSGLHAIFSKAALSSSAICSRSRSRGISCRCCRLSSKFFMYSLGVGSHHNPRSVAYIHLFLIVVLRRSAITNDFLWLRWSFPVGRGGRGRRGGRHGK